MRNENCGLRARARTCVQWQGMLVVEKRRATKETRNTGDIVAKYQHRTGTVCDVGIRTVQEMQQLKQVLIKRSTDIESISLLNFTIQLPGKIPQFSDQTVPPPPIQETVPPPLKPLCCAEYRHVLCFYCKQTTQPY